MTSQPLRALVASSVLLAIYSGLQPADRTAPTAKPSVKLSDARRLALPKPLSGGPAQASLALNIRHPLSHGEFVWDPEGAAAAPLWIRVDRSKQILSVFRGGIEIGTAVILYGAPGKPTPSGQFAVLSKHARYTSRTYDAEMPFALRLTHDGIFVHASVIRQGSATHGCIGLPEPFARLLFKEVKVGDQVVIV